MRKLINALGRSGRLHYRLAGLVMVSLGIILSLQSLARAADDNSDTKTVRSELTDFQMFGKELTADYIRPLYMVDQLRPTTGPVTPVRLRIPALNIDTNIEGVGLKKGAMDVPSNIWNTGWLKTGTRPGEAGNAVIDGHKDSVRGIAIFFNLYKLKPGDKVYVSDSVGAELTFEVTGIQSYFSNNAPLDKIFGTTDKSQLNLITCDGDFISSQASYDKRLVVFTRLVQN